MKKLKTLLVVACSLVLVGCFCVNTFAEIQVNKDELANIPIDPGVYNVFSQAGTFNWSMVGYSVNSESANKTSLSSTQLNANDYLFIKSGTRNAVEMNNASDTYVLISIPMDNSSFYNDIAGCQVYYYAYSGSTYVAHLMDVWSCMKNEQTGTIHILMTTHQGFQTGTRDYMTIKLTMGKYGGWFKFKSLSVNTRLSKNYDALSVYMQNNLSSITYTKLTSVQDTILAIANNDTQGVVNNTPIDTTLADTLDSIENDLKSNLDTFNDNVNDYIDTYADFTTEVNKGATLLQAIYNNFPTEFYKYLSLTGLSALIMVIL